MAGQVIESAVSLLDLRSRIQQGLHDIETGDVGPFDIEDIKRRGRERLAQRDGSGT